ncbi:hypothetical protein ACN42_g6731 [Penicillium freii]|uniref:Uncharacterized protein n=1 Tax=Penicillium freii TaxID=48697 RepID=A0A101MH17_PENFR|nr:hypothetical protein ACN42_g6731 [Penicillium freii]
MYCPLELHRRSLKPVESEGRQPESRRSTPSFFSTVNLTHTSIGCGKQGCPSAQPYLSHTGELIVGWVTTSESSLFMFLLFSSFFASHQRHFRMSAI